MKDFQLLINKGIICKIFFDETRIHSVKDLINLRLVTQIGWKLWLEKWWQDPNSNLPQEPIYELHAEFDPNIIPEFPDRIQLFRKETPSTDDVFDEYIYQNDLYEKIGQFSVSDDLLPLVKFEDLNNFYDYLNELKTTINNNYKKSKDVVLKMNNNRHKILVIDEILDIFNVNPIDVPVEEEVLTTMPPKFEIK